MPHVDGMSLRGTWTAQGQSRFARPVAALTAFVRRWTQAVAKPFHTPAPPRIRQDLEVRALEERFGRAADFADFTRMERDFEQRDAGGMRAWDWR